MQTLIIYFILCGIVDCSCKHTIQIRCYAVTPYSETLTLDIFCVDHATKKHKYTILINTMI